MSYEVAEDSLANLHSYSTDSRQNIHWPSVFVLPVWLKAWLQVFGKSPELFIRTVRREDEITGIAPLMLAGKTALFIGNTDVCDYLDFTVKSGLEKDFFNVLLDDLKMRGIKQMDLKHVRPDSTVLGHLMPIARERNYKVANTQEDVSLEMSLPSSWDEYLAALSTKQRHEVRRKLRRLSEEGRVELRFVSDIAAIPDTMKTFFKMFTESRQDKAVFLTEQMQSFFELLAEKMAEVGLFRLGVLELDSHPVAEVMCFDYNDCVYLYNSGYDPGYNSLSVGLLSKVLGIKDSIERGRKRFDFLKGAESYKYHLGGREVPLYRCQINIG